MSSVQTKPAAQKLYRTHTPLHGRSKDYAADLQIISESTSPMLKAETLLTYRRDEKITEKIEAMMRGLQGRRKRYTYNQDAVIALEHLVDGPLDPQTQQPIWIEMLGKTKGTTILKDEFMAGAKAILGQGSLYDPATMTS